MFTVPTRPDFVFEVLGDNDPSILLEMYDVYKTSSAHIERYLLIARLGRDQFVGIAFSYEDAPGEERPFSIFRVELPDDFYDGIQSWLSSLALPLDGYSSPFPGGSGGYFLADLLDYELKLSWKSWGINHHSVLEPKVRAISKLIQKRGKKFLWSENRGVYSPD